VVVRDVAMHNGLRKEGDARRNSVRGLATTLQNLDRETLYAYPKNKGEKDSLPPFGRITEF